MASLIWNSCLDDMANNNIDFGADTFYGMLLTSSFTPNKDTQTKRSDLSNEASGAGYTAGGAAATVTVTKDTANDRIDISLGAVSWAASTITARYLAYYKHRGGASSADELVALVDFGSDVSSTAGTFSVTASTLRMQN